jgi:rSAM/selenodomain-associated transferase 1
MTALLIIFAKEPRPGHVKTRLCPPLSPEGAAQLYHSFLLDILEEMARVPEVALALAYSPPGAHDFFRSLVPAGTDLFPQEGADLGERMNRAFDRGFAAAFSPVLLRGSDVPDLPASAVSEAQEVLAAGRAQVVLGPCPDGGYHLVGLPAPAPRLFRGVAWSGPTVLTDTLHRARQLGLKVHLLPPWPDIDTYADLRAFLTRSHAAPQAGWRSHQGGRRLLRLVESWREPQPVD